MPRAEEAFYYDSKRKEPVRYLHTTKNSNFQWWVEGLVGGESWVAHWRDLGGSTMLDPVLPTKEMGVNPPPRITEMEVIAYASR